MPMTADVVVNFLNVVPVVEHRKKVTGNEFLIGKFRFEIAQALMFQSDLRIVEMADQTKEFDKFGYLHKQILANTCLSAKFLLLIHIE